MPELDLIEAFVYPPSRPKRLHGPAGYKDVRSYRPWLRDEFSFRCVFCLIRERWGKIAGEFDLDHFVPGTQEASGTPRYDNLVYVCHSCNLRKGSIVLPDIRLNSGNVRVCFDGTLAGLTTDATRIIRTLWLNTPQTVRWRRTWIRIVQMAAEFDSGLYERLMGFPDDPPDLSGLRVPRNTKPNGVGLSYFSFRQRDELPRTYLDDVTVDRFP